MLPAIAFLILTQTADVVPLIEEDFKPHYRYVWTPSEDVYDHIVVDWVVNTVLSNGTVQVPTTPMGKVVRIDFSRLARDEKDLERLLEGWESFVKDEPYFSVEGLVTIDCAPYKASDGKVYTTRSILKRTNRHFSGLGTDVPVVELRYFLKKMLQTDYYRFRGVPGTQAEFLKQFAGVTEKDVADLRSDQKYATFFSGVTAKPRAVLVFRGIGGRVGVNQNLVMITQDISDDDVDPKKHPILNLIDNRFTATEIIIEMPNGFHAFGLFAGNGARQQFAPDNVARDHEIPSPYTARLGGAISCIRCHASHDGIKPVTNDVADLLQSYLGEVKKTDLDRAYGLYSATLDKPFDRARDDYSDATVFLGSRYKLPDRLSVAFVSKRISDLYASYEYERVFADTALKEIGYQLKEGEKPLEAFKKLVPDRVPEDPRIIALKRGKGINRSEFEQIYPLLTGD